MTVSCPFSSATVAAMFCASDGVVIELSQFPKVRPKFFDCSLISRFGYEHELLFVAPENSRSQSMDIASVRLMRGLETAEDHECLVRALRLLQKVISATILSKLERCWLTEMDYTLIERLIAAKTKTKDIDAKDGSLPPFMTGSFDAFCASQRRVRLDAFQLSDARFYSRLGALFLDGFVCNLVRVDFVSAMFCGAKVVESWDTGEVDSLFLMKLSKMLRRVPRQSALRKVLIHCDPLSIGLGAQRKRFREIGWRIRRKEDWLIELVRNSE